MSSPTPPPAAVPAPPMTTTTQGPMPARPAPVPAPHVTVIDRVGALEQKLAQLAGLHNQFAEDVTRELGL